MRIPVSATRLVDLLLRSASLTTLAFLMSVSLRNLSVSAAHDPHHGDLNLISKTCADLLQLAFSNPSFEVSVTLAFPLQAFTTLCKFVVVEKLDYDVVFGEYWARWTSENNGMGFATWLLFRILMTFLSRRQHSFTNDAACLFTFHI